MSHKPRRLILIHGAWAGAWVWDQLSKELCELGWQVEALDLPGDGFHPISAEEATESDYYQCLNDAINREEGTVALIGHSGGGMLVTAAANAYPDKVSHGIWIAGFLLPDGRSYDEILEQLSDSSKQLGAMDFAEYSDDGKTTVIPKAAAIKLFFHDAPAEVANIAADKLTPQPVSGGRLSTPTSTRFAALPKLYVLATEDRSIRPEAQRLMCAQVANLTIKEVNSGHAPQLTQAPQLATLVAGWLAGN